MNLTIDPFQNKVSADMAIRAGEYKCSLQFQGLQCKIREH